LLTFGASGMLPLHLSAYRGILPPNWERVVNKANKLGGTPLFLAAYGGKHEIVETLLQCGADVKAKGTNGETPLHAAARSGSVEIIKMLIEDAPKEYIDDTSNKYGYSPLFLAAMLNHRDAAEALLNFGANVNLQSSIGTTPIAIAATFRNGAVVELLVRKGAKSDIVDEGGNTALHAMMCHNDPTEQEYIIGHLVTAGAPVSAKNKMGDTAMSLAIANKNENGLTVLHYFEEDCVIM